MASDNWFNQDAQKARVLPKALGLLNEVQKLWQEIPS
jgi:hypothetical protein